MTIWRGEGGGGDATTDSEINFITSLTNSIAADTVLTSANAAAVTSLYDSFDDRYLGPKTSAPTLDNDGNALISGAIYWNTASNQMFVWSGVAWQQTFFSGTNVRSVFTATASQTVFTVPSYTTSNNTIQVYVNGFKVISGTDYTETNTTSITFSSGLTLGDEVEIIIAQPFSVGTTSADAVNYLPAGTGAVATTVQVKLRESVSAKDFGAVGDGVTDDTAALELCIAAAGVGGTILFPAGMNCKVSVEIDLNVSGQRVVGYGAKITKEAVFTGSCVFRVGATNVTIEGLEIDGTDKADDGIITSATVASGFKAKNLRITNCLYGISANSNNNVLIDGCHISDTARNSIRSQNVAGTVALSTVKVSNNLFDMTSVDPLTSLYLCMMVYGTSTYVTDNITIVNNTFLHVADPSNSAAMGCELRFCNNVVFSNNVCSGGSMMVSAAASKNVSITGNTGNNQTFYSIEVAPTSAISCENISITGNSIKGNNILNYGIGVQGSVTSKGLVIAGNSIEGTTLYGIYINDKWTDVSLVGNRVSITDTVSGSQYGIYLLGTTTPIQEVTISGNVLNGNTQGEKAIFLLNVQYASVTGNVCPDWTQNGVYISGTLATCDEISIVGNSFKGLTAGAIGKAGTLGDKIISYANTGYRRSGTTSTNDLNLNLDLFEAWGTGTPEAVVIAGIGSVFHRTNGGASTCLYIKESGTGNTGWVAK